MKKPKVPDCPYCNQQSKLVTGQILYPHRADLHHKFFYQCKPCDAYVGCHEGTKHPLGRLANEPLRRAKNKAHAAFDPIWKRHKFMKRSAAYAWLAGELGIPKAKTHIGMFDIETCEKVVNISKNLIEEIEFELGEIASHHTIQQQARIEQCLSS